MGRCVSLNFKLPWSISVLELRAVSTHPRFMLYSGLAQRHVWAVAGHSSHPELGVSLPPTLANAAGLTDPRRNAGVHSRGGERQWASSALRSRQSRGDLQAAHQYYGFRSPTKSQVTSWTSQASCLYLHAFPTLSPLCGLPCIGIEVNSKLCERHILRDVPFKKYRLWYSALP